MQYKAGTARLGCLSVYNGTAILDKSSPFRGIVVSRPISYFRVSLKIFELRHVFAAYKSQAWKS